MRFKKISPTVWAWISHLADSNLTATKSGLQINGDIIIPWAEIDAARALVTEDDDSIPAEMLRQVKENKPLSESQKRIQSIKNEMLQEALKRLDGKAHQEWGTGITAQPAYRAEQERRNQEMRNALEANPFADVEAKMMKPMTDGLAELIRKYE